MRALLIVLDSVGIGFAPDADAYGDAGADTLGHIYEEARWLALPNLNRLGLEHSRKGAAGLPIPPSGDLLPGASFAWMSESSPGKDTTTGHWELAGVILDEPFATFEAFPPELIQAIESEAGVQFIGNYPQSGTTILEELGQQHEASRAPILYTSADSVMQIAAHEAIIPLDQLYSICKISRKHADRYRIGRVIARPFIGSNGNYQRTRKRHDFSLRPPETVLDRLQTAGIPTTGVGKISDIFAGQGIDESFPTGTNSEGMAVIDQLWSDPGHSGLIFANLVDFDSKFGHRRDPEGYARCLREFDDWLGSFLNRHAPGEDELVIITADHGNDPTWPGSDHTRERVPLLMRSGAAAPENAGHQASFVAVAELLRSFFGV
ncbi:MAG: phosphopentomutase [Verrucomicrobiales bacterium]